MQAHRLKREIISTVLANRIVDIAGPVFILRLREQTGAPAAAIVAAFEVAYALLGAADLLAKNHQLDNQVPAQRQMAMQSLIATSLETLTHGALRTADAGSIDDRIDALSASNDALLAIETAQLPAYQRALQQRRVKQIARDGIPTDLAETFAQTQLVANAPLISQLALRTKSTPADASAAYLAVGDALSLDRLRNAADQALLDMPYWDRLATRGLVRELEQLQSDAAHLALQTDTPTAWVDQFRSERRALLNEIKTYTGTKPSFAQFALATDAVRKFMQVAAQS